MPERKGQEAGDGGEIAYNLLRAGVGEVFPSAESADAAALHAWALVRGLAMLILDRRVEWSEAMVERVVGLTFGGRLFTDIGAAWAIDRSEEHTSELQSLMRTSYAVFCLKNKQ